MVVLLESPALVQAMVVKYNSLTLLGFQATQDVLLLGTELSCIILHHR